MNAKRQKHLFLPLIIAFSIGLTAATHAATYDIYVAGVQVTDLNKDGVTGANITGLVTYNSATNTLTLNNARISTTTASALALTTNTPFNIKVIGDNVLHSNVNNGCWSNGTKIIFNGNGTVSCTSNAARGLYVDNNDLQITGGCTVSCSGGGFHFGVRTNNLTVDPGCSLSATQTSSSNGSQAIFASGNITLNSCKVIAYNFDTTIPAVVCKGTFKLNGCYFSSPVGAKWVDGTLYLSDGTTMAHEMTIYPVIKYGIKVAGTEVTSENMTGITGSAIKGSVTYDPNLNMLTLYNATINALSEQGIAVTTAPEFSLRIVGQSSVSSNNDALFSNATKTIIVIDGSVTLSSKNGSAVDTPNNDLLISGKGDVNCDNTGYLPTVNIKNLTVSTQCTLNATQKNTLNGAQAIMVNNNMTLNNCTVEATNFDKNYSAVRCGGSVALTECNMTIPTGGKWSLSNLYNSDGTTLAHHMKISPIVKYGIKVAGIEVTDNNKNGITGPGIIGSVTYDPALNMLTLYQASITNLGTDPAIDVMTGKEFSIRIVGGNSILSNNMTAIIVRNDKLIITGGGALTCNAPTFGNGIFVIGNDLLLTGESTLNCVSGSLYYALSANNLDVTSNCTLSALQTAPSNGGMALELKGNMTLDGCNLYAKNEDTNFSVIKCDGIRVLTNCNITIPTAAVWKNGLLYGIRGLFFAHELKITPTNTAISNETSEKVATSVDYYLVDGKQVMKPKRGFNLRVKRYSDGTSRKEKIFMP